VVLQPGVVLFTQGAVADLAYVVEEGSVEVVRVDEEGGEQVLAVLEAGSPVGEMGPLFGLPRSATVRGHTTARLTGYTPQAFRERLGVDSLADIAGRRVRSVAPVAPVTPVESAPAAETGAETSPGG
jgi:putative ABC transport system ATP-binding protein